MQINNKIKKKFNKTNKVMESDIFFENNNCNKNNNNNINNNKKKL
jgi:hypothetical protein